MPEKKDWFDKVPKAELHLHLEGAIPLPALWELIKKYGGDPTVRSPAALEKRFVYKDFPQFIETWKWKNKFLREYDDFTFIAEAAARDLAAQNVKYAEAFYSPSGFQETSGLRVGEITTAVRKGLGRVRECEVNLIADVIRDLGPDLAGRTLSEVAEVKSLGVIGIGLGGSEQSFPPEPFAAVYEKARALGLHTTAHAGEAAGPESVWSALRDLKAERIGHGTRSVEDEKLLACLAEKKIPLEICPLSNVRTGVVPSIDLHPVRRFFERGIPVTVSTDDPKMFGNSLAEEYRLLESRLGFTRDEIRSLILQSIRSSWLDSKTQRKYVISFTNHPSWGE
jgi:adenosine deaminase